MEKSNQKNLEQEDIFLDALARALILVAKQVSEKNNAIKQDEMKCEVSSKQ